MTAEPPGQTEEPAAKEKITKAAGAVASATLISRVLGYVRDMIIAHLFGARAAADAFFVAFRIPNLMRRLTAEGAMTAAFIPVFTETLGKKGKKEAFRLGCDILTIGAVALVSLTAAAEIFAPWLVRAIAPGFTDDPRVFELTTLLTRIILPYLALVSIAAVLMAILNSMGRFFIPASAPALLNIAIITSALALHGRLAEPTMALAVGVVAGGFLQIAIQLPPLARLGWRYVPSFNMKDPGVRKVGALMAPAALGMAAAEINVLVDTLLASLLPEGSVSYLYYGNRITQFPLGVFGVAVGVAALPSMSGEVAKNGAEKLVELVSHSLRLTLFISIPATVGLIALAGPITNVLFERGEFGAAAREGTAFALIFYSIGLFAFSGVKVVVPAFYSLKDTKTPTRVASWLIALNVALNIILMRYLAHGGLALATSISSMANLFILLWLLKKRIGDIDGARVLASTWRMAAAAAVMVAAVAGFSTVFFSYGSGMAERAFILAAAVLIGALVYFLAALALGSREAAGLKDRMMKRAGPGR